MSALPPLSAVAKFDDLMRCSRELTAGVAEESEKIKANKKSLKKIFENFIFFSRISSVSPSI
jgi:hypothetical protein